MVNRSESIGKTRFLEVGPNAYHRRARDSVLRETPRLAKLDGNMPFSTERSRVNAPTNSRSIFYPKPTGDVGRDRNARTLQFSFLLFACALAAVAGLDLISRDPLPLPILACVLGLVVAAALNRLGKSGWAARAAVFTMMLGGVFLVVGAHDGFRSHAMLVFPGMLLISVMLLDRTSYMAIACFLLLAVAALGIAEQRGLTKAIPGVRSSTTYDSIFNVDLMLAVFGLIGSRIVADIQRNASDLRTSLDQLSTTNRELLKTADALGESDRIARARAAELQAIMDAAPAAILVSHDADANQISGNRTAHHLTREQLGGSFSIPAQQGGHPTIHQLMLDGVEISRPELPLRKAALTQDRVRNCELQIYFDDGSSIDLLGNVEPMLGADGQSQGAVAVFCDITDRKRAEQAVRESERELATIYNTVRDVIFHLSVEPRGTFRFVSVNAAFLRVTGLTQEAVVGKTVEEVIPEPSLRMVLGKYRQALQEKTTVSWEETSDYASGRLTGEVSIAPVLDDHGVCTHLVGSVHDITARKKAEASLRESEERFRNMADSAPVMIWVSGLGKQCTFFNKPWLDFTGRTMDDELGTGWMDNLHPEDIESYSEAYRSSFDSRCSFQTEYRLRRQDGEFRWVLDYATPLFRGGVFAGFIGSCVDITERKLLAQRLQDQTVQFMDAQRLANVGSWEQRVKSNGIDWSEEMFRIFAISGSPPPDLESFLGLVHPNDREKVLNSADKVRAGRVPVELSYRIIRPNGEVRYVRTIAQTIRNEADAPSRVVGAVQDVTEQVRTFDLLRESERRLKTAERLAHLGHWNWDLSSEQVAWSDEMFRIFGQALDYNPTYPGFLQAFIPQDRERIRRDLRDALADHSGVSGEAQITRPDGDLRTIRFVSEPLFNEEGALHAMFGAAQDITEIRRAQHADFARQKLESVGRLAGGIAHDFNNLLGSVLVQAEVALRGLDAGLGPEEELKTIRDVALRGSEIVRELMIYAGKESPVVETVDLSNVVKEMLELLRVSISKHARLVVDLAKNVPAVRADAAQLRQIIMNLVINASDAIGQQNGVIRLRTGCVTGDQHALPDCSKDADYTLLEVFDTGCGMTSETRAKIFEPFFTTKSAGHGLGLSIVDGIVRSLQGVIRIDSEPGEGTTFQILLPSAEEGAIGTPRSIVEDVPHPSVRGAILIVEDEAPLRQAVAKMLHHTGFEVVQADNGSAAIDFLRANTTRIDLILLDMTIPGASSPQVVAEAAKLRPDTKIVLTSAYSEEMIAGAINSPQVRTFIRKPFKLGDLVKTLQNTLAMA